MDKEFLNPAEIALNWVNIGKNKANLNKSKMLLMGILAGVFIGFGSHAFLVMIQTLGNFDVGLAKFMGASVFPVGLILIVVAGAELFTGNNLMTISVLAKEEKFSKVLKNWFFVYTGNIIGSVLLAYLLSKSGLYAGDAGVKALAVAESKVSLTLTEALIRGIMCNILVVLAVWMQAGTQNTVGKILILWCPIMLFVLSGFEHSIANMYFIYLGKFLGASFSWADMWIYNLIPVTIGNMIGGAVIVPFGYWYVYLKDKKDKSDFAA